MFWITQHVVLEVFYCVELINVGAREAKNLPGRDMDKMTPAMLEVFANRSVQPLPDGFVHHLRASRTPTCRFS